MKEYLRQIANLMSKHPLMAGDSPTPSSIFAPSAGDSPDTKSIKERVKMNMKIGHALRSLAVSVQDGHPNKHFHNDTIIT